jgi:hypothetical protein
MINRTIPSGRENWLCHRAGIFVKRLTVAFRSVADTSHGMTNSQGILAIAGARTGVSLKESPLTVIISNRFIISARISRLSRVPNRLSQSK